MKTTHTPGQWKIVVDLNNQFSRDEQGSVKPFARIVGNIDEKGDGDTIADVTTRFYNGNGVTPRSLEGEWQANARLIAAAPDLLEACLAVYQDPHTTCACAEKVRAAIAKATEAP